MKSEKNISVSLDAPPPAKLPTTTSFTPVTPLRWKSSKRLEAKKEAIKPKEVKEEVRNSRSFRRQDAVKEEVRKSKSFKDDAKEQDKTKAVPKQGVNGHKSDTPGLEKVDPRKVDATGASHPSSSELSVPVAAKAKKHTPAVNGVEVPPKSDAPVLGNVDPRKGVATSAILPSSLEVPVPETAKVKKHLQAENGVEVSHESDASVLGNVDPREGVAISAILPSSSQVSVPEAAKVDRVSPGVNGASFGSDTSMLETAHPRKEKATSAILSSRLEGSVPEAAKVDKVLPGVNGVSCKSDASVHENVDPPKESATCAILPSSSQVSAPEAANVKKNLPAVNGVEVSQKSDTLVLENIDPQKGVATSAILLSTSEVSAPEAEKVDKDLQGLNGVEISHESDTSVLGNVDPRKEDATKVTLPSSLEPMVPDAAKAAKAVNVVEEEAREQKPLPSEMSNGQAVDGHTKPREEVSPTTIVEKGTTDHSSSGEAASNDRKTSAGDEPSVITIDFLRARLLAERASSKAARERIQQLTRKVLDLEAKLEEEMQLRKKSDEAAQEAHLKLQSAESLAKETSGCTKTVPEVPGEIQEPGKTSEDAGNTSQTESSACGREPGSSLGEEQRKQQQRDLSCTQEKKNPAQDNVNDPSTNTSKLGNPHSMSLNVKNGEGKEKRDQDNRILQTKQQVGEGAVAQSGTKMQASQSMQSEEAQEVSTSAATGIESSHVEMTYPSKPGLSRQEKRSVMEERLRNMLDQMTEQMAALTEDRTQEEQVREELLNWMGQVPAVLQDILPKNSEKKLVTLSNSESMQPEDIDVSLADPCSGQRQEKDKEEGPSSNGVLPVETKRTNSANKKVSSLVEQYEAQETVQRTWEQNYNTNQNSAGSKRSNEGSMCRTNSDLGTQLSGGSQPDSQQETGREGHTETAHIMSSRAGDARFDIHITSSPVVLSKSKSTENFLPRTENGTAPHVDALYAYPEPPSVPGERFHPGNSPHGGYYRGEEPSIGQRELGVERSLDPSFMTPPPLHSESPGRTPRQSRGDLRSSTERLQIQEQNEPYSAQSAGRGGRYENYVSHSGRSSMEREEVHRSQGLPPPKESRRNGELLHRGSSSHWDASFVSPHIQHERLPPQSQAGHSNAYMRPDVPPSYPGHNEEREVYCGRMESVSRSMEGLGTSWRPVAGIDGWQGDEGSPYWERQEPNAAAGFSSKRDAQFPAQVKESSRRSLDYHTENPTAMPDPERQSRGEPRPSVANLGWELSTRGDAPKRPGPKADNTSKDSTSKVSEVLRALQAAKVNIQNSGSKKQYAAKAYVETTEQSYPGSDKAHSNLQTGYRSESGSGSSPSLGSPAVGGWPNQELRRYSTGHFQTQHGSPNMHRPPGSSAAFNKSDHHHANALRRYDPREDRPLAGRSSPVSEVHSRFVDKMSVGNGIQLFF